MTNEPILLSAEEAAEVLGIGRTFVFELVAKGRLESIKIGRRRLIPRDALERLVAEEWDRQATVNGARDDDRGRSW